MKISIEIEPFTTPNFVRQKGKISERQNGFIESITYKLDEIEAEVLSELCDEFRREVFSKAGKTDPKLVR